MKWKYEAEEGTMFLCIPVFFSASCTIGTSIASMQMDQPNSMEFHSIVTTICIIIMSCMIVVLDGCWF